jgi:N-acetyl-D-muramate 6-phosphate phosphatase
MKSPRGVLFDLDGTLADTAADLTAALNSVLQRHGIPALEPEQTRAHVSGGASALLQLGLGASAGDPRIDQMRPMFLEHYQNHLCVHTRLFPGIRGILRQLARRHIPIAVVTNKPRLYTVPLLEALNLPAKPASIVCGDDLPTRKPHPAPVRAACRAMSEDPFDCVFIGDDRRDIVAGFRAGTGTIVAAYGYIGPAERPSDWGADALIDSTERLASLLLDP